MRSYRCVLHRYEEETSRKKEPNHGTKKCSPGINQVRLRFSIKVLFHNFFCQEDSQVSNLTFNASKCFHTALSDILICFLFQAFSFIMCFCNDILP